VIGETTSASIYIPVVATVSEEKINQSTNNYHFMSFFEGLTSTDLPVEIMRTLEKFKKGSFFDFGHPLKNMCYDDVSDWSEIVLDTDRTYFGQAHMIYERPYGLGVMLDRAKKTVRFQWYRMGLEWGDFTLINDKGTIERGSCRKAPYEKNKTETRYELYKAKVITISE